MLELLIIIYQWYIIKCRQCTAVIQDVHKEGIVYERSWNSILIIVFPDLQDCCKVNISKKISWLVLKANKVGIDLTIHLWINLRFKKLNKIFSTMGQVDGKRSCCIIRVSIDKLENSVCSSENIYLTGGIFCSFLYPIIIEVGILLSVAN